MTEAAKQLKNPSKSTQKPLNYLKIILSCTCRRGCRRTFLSGFKNFGDMNAARHHELLSLSPSLSRMSLNVA